MFNMKISLKFCIKFKLIGSEVNLKKKFVSMLLSGLILTCSTSSFAFEDIDDHWSCSYVLNLSSKSIINGYGDNTFKPDNPITREEAAKIISQYIGDCDAESSKVHLTDIEGRWSTNDIVKLLNKNIICGYSDSKFMPEKNITRAEFADIVYNVLNMEGRIGNLTKSFTDTSSHWASSKVSKLAGMGIIDGYGDNKFRPDSDITRAEVAKIVSSICSLSSDAEAEENDKPVEDSKPVHDVYILDNSPRVTVDQMQKWARSKGASQLFVDLAPTFHKVALETGVNAAVLYTQSAKETGYMKFGGVLDASYKNPCGLKTSAGGGDYDASAHKKFSTWEDGIQAQADHLALYAGHPDYPKANSPDPRHFAFLLGSAKNVSDLGGKWAPASDYGTSIVTLINELIATK